MTWIKIKQRSYQELVDNYMATLGQIRMSERDRMTLMSLVTAMQTRYELDVPKWHDLRKDPTDLPELTHDVLVQMSDDSMMVDFRQEGQVIGMRKNDTDWFLGSDEDEGPIAWRELPERYNPEEATT